MKVNQIYCGHVLNILKEMPANCIDCVVTSPPYWGLRSYGTDPIVWDGGKDCEHQFGTEKIIHHKPSRRTSQISLAAREGQDSLDRQSQGSFCSKCRAWKGELGLEPNFNLYIQHLIQIFAEIKRVLKLAGTCWVNLGDSYNGSGGSHKEGKKNDASFQGEYSVKCGGTGRHSLSLKPKSLCGIPERFTLAMTDHLGFTRRNTIIWYKRNCMPSPVSDRLTVDFELIYFFTKSKRYFFEQQFEPYAKAMDRWGGDKLIAKGKSSWDEGVGQTTYRDREMRPNPSGKNMRCVWDIPTKPFSGAHFAVFPATLVERMIKAGCPEFICKKCGAGRKKILEPTAYYKQFLGKGNLKEHHVGQDTHEKFSVKVNAEYEHKGYTDCGCEAGFKEGIVLDPFCGSGTVCMMAKRLDRRYIGIDAKQEYCEMAEKRILEGK